MRHGVVGHIRVRCRQRAISQVDDLRPSAKLTEERGQEIVRVQFDAQAEPQWASANL
jgi:hypothetical protein